MSLMSKNRGLLPVVIAENVKALRREIAEHPDGYEESIIERLRIFNPFIVDYMSNLPSPENEEEIKRAVTHVYRLLEMRADKLPTVDGDSVKAVLDSYDMRDRKDVLARLREDNPFVEYIISEYAEESVYPRSIEHVGCLAYLLFESGAKAEKLESVHL